MSKSLASMSDGQPHSQAALRPDDARATVMPQRARRLKAAKALLPWPQPASQTQSEAQARSAAPAKPKRTRLKPEVRAQLILDAALVEFSQHGFVAARIADIAARAGLTKTGVYAHYDSKDAIFEALLQRVLQRSQGESSLCWMGEMGEMEEGAGEGARAGHATGPRGAAALTLEARVDAFLDTTYRQAQDPATQKVFRLLLTESARVPEGVQRWLASVLSSQAQAQAQVQTAVQHGVLRASPLTEAFTLAQAPLVMWMLSQALAPNESHLPLSQVRRMHRFMLLELLQPQ